MDIDKIYEKGEKYYIAKDYNKALKYFKNGYAISEDGDFLNYIGCCYLNLNKIEESILAFQELIKIYPNWGRPVFNLGRVYLKLDIYSKALRCFNRAVKINPEDEDAYYYLGLYYQNVDNYEKAINCYKKSLRLNDLKAEPHLNLGLCYFRTNRYKQAIWEFDICYEEDNDCEDALFNKAITLLHMGRYMQSLYTSLELYKINSKDIENILNIGECYYRLGNLSCSENRFKEVLKDDPLNSMANKFLKKIRFKSK
ncbi:tetratricopeptide repeat protein [Clostridium felsineum]|uniref:tetratricopeptide repeat protein n=1 Tax=Clostridium felsineum TaxID=36839 RepID=UPI00214DC2A7|nr:tetratricopeptide repeat protein [Clostridium felsineum]MCR3759742.1 tetratricopeptide repeat protein [Clostridium felsineum]